MFVFCIFGYTSASARTITIETRFPTWNRRQIAYKFFIRVYLCFVFFFLNSIRIRFICESLVKQFKLIRTRNMVRTLIYLWPKKIHAANWNSWQTTSERRRYDVHMRRKFELKATGWNTILISFTWTIQTILNNNCIGMASNVDAQRGPR